MRIFRVNLIIVVLFGRKNRDEGTADVQHGDFGVAHVASRQHHALWFTTRFLQQHSGWGLPKGEKKGEPGRS